MSIQDEIMTTKEVAAHLCLSESIVYKLIHEGKISAEKTGNQWKIKKELINEMIGYQMKSFHKEDLADLEIDQEKKFIEIHTLLNPKHMILNLISPSKSKVLTELTSVLNKTKTPDKIKILLNAVRDREKLCTTAIGEGIAIPHPRKAIKNFVKKPLLIFGRSKIGVDFESIDGNLTHLFFLVCAPKDDTHLKIMARLSRLLRNYPFRKALLDAPDSNSILDVVKEYEKQDKINV